MVHGGGLLRGEFDGGRERGLLEVDASRPLAIIAGEVISPPSTARQPIENGDRSGVGRQPDHPETFLAQQEREHVSMKSERAGVVQNRFTFPIAPASVKESSKRLKGVHHLAEVLEEVNPQAAATLEPAAVLVQGTE